ncbi:MAG: hypothetical protein KIG56_05300, partial [Bacteroidales bacterium]|nr:hypothetical protein [Bacteroidales bacterium]
IPSWAETPCASSAVRAIEAINLLFIVRVNYVSVQIYKIYFVNPLQGLPLLKKRCHASPTKQRLDEMGED